MSTKQPNPARSCTCSLCGLTAVSIPNTRHRRCGGAIAASPVSKRDRRAWSTNAGKWL